MNGVLPRAAVLVPAALAMLISPPYGWLLLHPFVFIAPFWAIGQTTGRNAFALGWAAGAVVYLAVFPWLPETVVQFSKLPLWVGVIAYFLYAAVSGLFVGVFGLGYRALRRASGPAWPLAIALWFSACEFLNPQIIPFYQSVAWYEVSSLFLLVSLAGMSGGTFLIILCNTVLLQGIELVRGREGRSLLPLALQAGALVVGIALAMLVSSQRSAKVAAAEAEADSIRVAIVQPNVHGGQRKALKARGSDAIARDLLELSAEALADGPIDAFVWPESALAAVPSAAENAEVIAFARSSQSEIWTGVGFSGRQRDDERRPFNAAFRIDASGEIDTRYDKIALIPFGEYVPFRSALPALARVRGLGRYLPGEDFVVYEAKPPFTFLICYEAIVPSRVREAFSRGARLLVNVTFDGWFGDTAAPHQHLMLAAAQAAQFGIPVVRSATSGISAFIDARGVITQRSGLFTREVLVGEVELVNAPSVYARYGDWFGWICVMISAALLARAYRMHRSAPASR